jgi:uncharacterized membrane protein YgdD (TMEM256/DUF423 family)
VRVVLLKGAMEKTFFAIGACSAALAVLLGSFGAHGLKGRLSPEQLAVFETGVRYQLAHALGLLAAAWAAGRFGGDAARWGGWLLVAGSVLFSGSLYALTLTGVRWLGLITPFGGVAFIVGWVLLAMAALRG